MIPDSTSNNKEESAKKIKIKDITLRAFKIENSNIAKINSGIVPLLIEKIENSIAKDRRLVLNPEDVNLEHDLISDYKIIGNKLVKGVMLRVMPKENVPTIPDLAFDKKTIDISSLKTDSQFANLYKDHYYFILSNSFLVTNLKQPQTITHFQSYMNWFLEDLIENNLFEITPIITDPPKDIKIQDLKNIMFRDPVNDNKTPESQTKNIIDQKILRKISKAVLSSIIEDNTIGDVKLDQIISAELVLKFKKPKSMSAEEFKKYMGATLKPIADNDNVVFHTKNHGTIKASTLLKTKKVSIELTSSGLISEEQLYQEMTAFINSLEADNS